eukprot:s1609_g10.t1
MGKCCEFSSSVMLEPKQPSQAKSAKRPSEQVRHRSHASACPKKTSARSAHGDTGPRPESGLQVQKDPKARGKTFENFEPKKSKELQIIPDLWLHPPSTNAQGVATPQQSRCRHHSKISWEKTKKVVSPLPKGNGGQSSLREFCRTQGTEHPTPALHGSEFQSARDSSMSTRIYQLCIGNQPLLSLRMAGMFSEEDSALCIRKKCHHFIGNA